MEMKLRDTTLAAIVRDEKDNPAWGIELWLRCTLPYVEEAVVVDTGSVDGTKEILEGLRREYDHLRVYDHQFDGFASSRNFSLKHVHTKRVLIMDADELLEPIEFFNLSEYINAKKRKFYHLSLRKVFPNGKTKDTNSVLNPRIFNLRNGMEFKTSAFISGEYLNISNLLGDGFIPSNVAILKHFLPNEEALYGKNEHWYEGQECLSASPLEHAEKYGWKKRNPFRENYVPSPIDILTSRSFS